MLCTHTHRIAMKNPCLITGFFDCCRVHAPSASQHTAGAGRSIVKKLILYACDRNSEAFDGKGKHGSECICQNKAFLFVEWDYGIVAFSWSFCTKSPSSLCVLLRLWRNTCVRMTVKNMRMYDCRIYSTSNHVRRFHGLPARAFDNSKFGIRQVSHAGYQRRDRSTWGNAITGLWKSSVTTNQQMLSWTERHACAHACMTDMHVIWQFREDNLSDAWCLFTNEKYPSRPSHVSSPPKAGTFAPPNWQQNSYILFVRVYVLNIPSIIVDLLG